MTLARPDWRDRLRAAIPTALIVGGMGYALILGLGFAPGVPISSPALDSFDVTPPAPPPPPRVRPQKVATHRPRGAAAPPNIRSQATEIVAPPPLVVLPPVSPVVVAPVAGTGADASQGASDRPGPGTGAGGIGNGTGSGGSGDGDGYGDETPPELIRGRITPSDYPPGASRAEIGGKVTVRYFVNVDGRVSGCVVTRSSGNAELDETTCRLVTRRFRYAPSRDADGRPVGAYILQNHEWVPEPDND
ncbi:energy transducer TonB [Sphingomonas sp. Leaf21]|uniref:energy transducer TonB n=1 Tax=Sphingomonas sp. Leaf21 TaxID=2876550 RepID=UPI001E5114EB|nr:energy transducer TonB [Sphingomonas sp. Leaf21]